MPEPPPNQRNICKKPKKKTVYAEENTRKMKKKIRLIFSDPYATESSDDERSGFEPKRIVREINLPLAILNPTKAPESESSCQDSNNGENPPHRKRVSRLSPKFPSSIIPGFRQRKRDRWADPVSGKSLWLGTFNSSEEASGAIERKKIEFASIAGDKNCYYSFSVSVSENSETSSHTSPPCVLESDTVVSQSDAKFDETVKDAGVDTNLVEKNGIDSVELDMGMEFDSLFVGDFCGLDGLQLCGFEDVEQIDLPDFDFELGSEELAWIDEGHEAINVACT